VPHATPIVAPDDPPDEVDAREGALDGELRVRVPLWVKLGVLFGGLFGAAIAINGWWEFRTALAQEEQRRESQLRAFAAALALGIDGELHETFLDEPDRGTVAFRRTREQLRAVLDASEQVDWGATSRRDEQGHWGYVIDASETAPFPIGYPIFDGIPGREAALAGDVQFVEALEDEFGRWHTVYAPIRDDGGQVVGLVELVSDADRDLLVVQGRIRRSLLQLGAAIVVTLLASFLFGRILSRHLAQLVRSARAVAQGRLEGARVDIPTHDEIGVLGAAFNQMVAGLEEREFIRDTFGRFVNREVVASILEDRGKLKLGGERRTVTVIMSDLRGFTALSEELGAEGMVGLLNRYLSRMTEVVTAHDGNVSELLGDGMVILFGAPVARPDDAERAVRCAVAMQQELVRFREQERRDLHMGIGIDTGVVIAGNIGGEEHMKYGVVGPPINLASRLEAFTLGSQVLISEATREQVGDAVRTERVIEFRAKGRRLPLRCFPVISAGDLEMPEEQDLALAEVRVPGQVWRVTGKQIDDEAHRVVVVRLDNQQLVMEVPFEPVDRQDLKIELSVEGTIVPDLYGTVAGPDSEGRGVLVRLTSVPSDARRVLDAWLLEHTDDARL
jgi:class 3 adenylate cyclase